MGRVMKSLEPTYEGLKQVDARRTTTTWANGLEPTYEGLKQEEVEHRGDQPTVWSLPMRD